MTQADYDADPSARELFLLLVRAIEGGAFDDLVKKYADGRRDHDGPSRKAYGRESRERIAALLDLPFEETWDRPGGPPLAWWLGHDLHVSFGADLGRGSAP